MWSREEMGLYDRHQALLLQVHVEQMSPSIHGMSGSLWIKLCRIIWSVVVICNNARKKNDACQSNHNEGSKSVSAKRLHLRPMWAEGTLNRSMTGILIYSVRSLFSHSPLSQANVKPFHSKPTPVTSKLKNDIMHYPRSPRVLQFTWHRKDSPIGTLANLSFLFQVTRWAKKRSSDENK